MTRVLVTGATTPTGVRVVELLLEDPANEVVLAVGGGPDFPGSAIASDEDHRLVYVQCDLTRARHVKRMLFGPAQEHGIEVLLHMAFHRPLYCHWNKVPYHKIYAGGETQSYKDFPSRLGKPVC